MTSKISDYLHNNSDFKCVGVRLVDESISKLYLIYYGDTHNIITTVILGQTIRLDIDEFIHFVSWTTHQAEVHHFLEAGLSEHDVMELLT